jgi:hypothetical protein
MRIIKGEMKIINKKLRFIKNLIIRCFQNMQTVKGKASKSAKTKFLEQK